MKKYILLCDFGLDDAVAAIYLLNNIKNAAFDIVAIGGNVPRAQSHKNARTLLTHFEGDKSHIRIVDTSCVVQPEENLTDIHGNDGIGGILTPAFDTSPVEEIDYLQFLNEITEDDYLLSLGPCTITRDILSKKRVANLVIMAGNVNETPNFKGYEFNHQLDKDAFAFSVKFPHLVATLDTCRLAPFNYVNAKSGKPDLLSRLIDRAIELETLRHPEHAYIYDYIAAQFVVNPHLFTAKYCVDKDGNALNMLTIAAWRLMNNEE